MVATSHVRLQCIWEEARQRAAHDLVKNEYEANQCFVVLHMASLEYLPTFTP
jgi:hypothetical protein